MIDRLNLEYTIKHTVSDNDYKVIEYVCKYHPYFQNHNEDENIKKITILYNNFGISIIKTMVYVANRARKLNTYIDSLKLQLEKYEKELLELETGDFAVYMTEEE